MKYLDEFSDPDLAARLLDEIAQTVTRPWAIMEVCGGQTHTIIRNGIDQLLPDGVELIHGPGCPVCVTPLETIDRALAIAARPDVIFCSFGDMIRVPGSSTDLFRIKSEGGDVRIVYSPLDAVRLAQANPDKQVVFFGIGFETTAPANAMTVTMAKQLGLTNFSLLVSHVLVPPAIRAIMDSPVASGAGLPRRRARLHGDGDGRVRPARRGVPRAHRRHRASSRSTCSRASGACSCSWSRAAPSWRTPTRGPSSPRATRPRRRSCATCSPPATGPGEGSARSRPRAGAWPTRTPTSTRSCAST